MQQPTPSPSSPSSPSPLALFHLDQGNTYLINNQFQEAITSYTNCIELQHDPQNEFITFRAFSHRAESYLKLKDYTNAKVDLQSCHSLLVGQTDFDMNEVGMSYLRLGTACFESQDYESSLQSFVKAEEMLKSMSAKNDGNDLNSMLICEYKTKCEQMLPTPSPTSSPSTTATAATTATTAPNATATTVKSSSNKAPTMPKYQYYQNDKFMTVAILEPNLTAEHVEATFSLDKLTVIIEKGTNPAKKFTVICGTLFSAVIVSKCKVKITDEKVLIKLKKKHTHEWNTLFGGGANDNDREEEGEVVGGGNTTATNAGGTIEDAANTATTTTTPVPTIDSSTTSRPYASHRDWDAIGRNLEQEEEAERPEGEGAFNKFLKDMYAGADEKTKRAMIKSYQTSGGTHLSGNWDEVEKTDYEKQRTAPKGQEWKNWEGKKLPMKEN